MTSPEPPAGAVPPADSGGPGSPMTSDLAAGVIEGAARAGLTIGTAESLTGGAVAAALVSVPGASAAFEGSVVSYSHAVKTRVLGVDAGLLADVGAVDAEVARAMARGARTVLGVDLAVSTTGVAGPEPHDGQPVGTVWLGLAHPLGVECRQLRLDGDRARIRSAAVQSALELLNLLIVSSQ